MENSIILPKGFKDYTLRLKVDKILENREYRTNPKENVDYMFSLLRLVGTYKVPYEEEICSIFKTLEEYCQPCDEGYYVEQKDFWKFESLVKNFIEDKKSEQLKYLDEHKEEEEGKLILAPSSLVSKYYNQDITLDFRPNAPKLNKQLKNHGIATTQKELQAFSEMIDVLLSMYSLTYIDLTDMKIDYENKDDWAFSGSCHRAGGAGENTPKYLAHHNFMYMLKGYSLALDTPKFRAYFAKDGENMGHSGAYYETNKIGESLAYVDNKLSRTAYQFTSLLLAIIFNKKLDDFLKTSTGIKMPHDEIGIWANIADDSNYSKYVYSPDYGGAFLGKLELEQVDVEWLLNVVYSEYLEEYIDLTECDAVWVNNVDSYMPEGYTDLHNCENCDDCFVSNACGTETTYNTRDGWMCSSYCLNDYFEIEEY